MHSRILSVGFSAAVVLVALVLSACGKDFGPVGQFFEDADRGASLLLIGSSYEFKRGDDVERGTFSGRFNFQPSGERVAYSCAASNEDAGSFTLTCDSAVYKFALRP